MDVCVVPDASAPLGDPLLLDGLAFTEKEIEKSEVLALLRES